MDLVRFGMAVGFMLTVAGFAISAAAGPAAIGLLLSPGVTLTATLWLGAAVSLGASLLPFAANIRFGIVGGRAAKLAHTLGK